MGKSYRHVSQYEKELLELKAKGKTVREIGEKHELTKEQTHDFFKRYNKKQRRIEEGIAIKPKGRPRKDGVEVPPSIQQLSKLTQLQYELARKESHIKRLKMKNELMRDFFSLIERK